MISIIAQPKQKNKNSATATIYIRGYYKRKCVASISTGKNIAVQHWDAISRQVIPAAPNAKLINDVINIRIQGMNARLMKMELMGTNVNRSHIKKVIKGFDDTTDFYLFCTNRILEYKNKDTRTSYTSEVTKLKKFMDPVSFADVDYSFLTRYKSYMQNTLGNCDNTVWKTFKFICTMMNKALKTGGIINENPFKEFDRGKYVQGKRNFLELADCIAIEKLLDYHDIMIRKVATYFLLMAYSGMRFKDAMRFDPAKDVVNNERIVMKYQKCNTEINNKMYSRLLNIVDRVRKHPLQLSNKEFNINLKIIAGICNIPINLTAHVGRHTMGGFLAELDIPLKQSQKILGHKKSQSTEIYYHMKNKSIDTAMDKFNAL